VQDFKVAKFSAPSRQKSAEWIEEVKLEAVKWRKRGSADDSSKEEENRSM
jgi:hypothetical protein